MKWKQQARKVKKLRMTISQWIKSNVSDINFNPSLPIIHYTHSTNILPYTWHKHYPRSTSRKGRKASNYCKKYISAKRKGKTTKIGTKSSKHTFHQALCLTYQATSTKEIPKQFHQAQFDSDSFEIGVDNHASRCISNNINHFITEISPTPNAKLRGTGGTIPVLGEGTIKWNIADDNGKAHDIIIRNCLYVPDAPTCLLSPQHWSQQSNDNSPNRNGTWCATYGDSCVLFWDQQRYQRTVPHSNSTNTPKLYSAPGCKSYRKKAAAIEFITKPTEIEKTIAFSSICHPVAISAHLIPPDNEDDHNHISTDNEPIVTLRGGNQQQTLHEEINNFTTDSPSTTPNIIPSEESEDETENINEFMPSSSNIPVEEEVNEDKDTSALSPQGELLRWHYRLGHMPFKRMKLLAVLGILPRSILEARNPKCAGCLLGGMTKVPWRVKGTQNRRSIKQVSQPGECVSVDQMESRTPGFIAVLRGFITKKRYNSATIFIDHASDLSYVYPQTSLTVEETIKAKKSFEAYASSKGVKIKHYHADNGRFADKKFVLEVEKEGQTLSFCAAHAHFQNGKAEKRIRDLQEQARKVLLHSISKWPKASSTHLWPYALRHVNDIRNNIPNKSDGSSPVQRFTGVEVQTKMKTFHTFGCPVYSLNTKLQNNQSIPKWEPRAQVGLYLGNSPRHARSVSLVLNLQTGRVSPQFHIQHDEFFETTIKNDSTIYKWKQVAGFKGILRQTKSVSTSSTTSRLPGSPDRNQLVEMFQPVLPEATDHIPTENPTDTPNDFDSNYEAIQQQNQS